MASKPAAVKSVRNKGPARVKRPKLLKRPKRLKREPYVPLLRALAGYWHMSFDQLPRALQVRVLQDYPMGWDSLGSARRMEGARLPDLQHTEDKPTRQEMEEGFRAEVVKESIRRRNRRNAKHPRPNAQRIPEADILAGLARLRREKVAPHQQISTLHRWLKKAITLRGLRKRVAALSRRLKRGT